MSETATRRRRRRTTRPAAYESALRAEAIAEAKATIADRLREAVLDDAITSLAAAADMSPDRLRQILAGERQPCSSELAVISDLLRVDVHWLITGEPDPLAARVIACSSSDIGQ